MDWTARWIWIDDKPNPWNYWLSARRTFELSGSPDSALIHITADTRYVLWVNGERLGQGPVRAWPDHWSYDTYDLRGRLTAGVNTIAVLVLHYGVGTFQSLPTRAGLLVQVEADGQVVAATDSSWKLAENTGYERATPRITCQQAWTEHFSAFWEQVGWQNIDLDEESSRKWHLGEPVIKQPVFWQSSGFDDSAWTSALEIGEPGCKPWTSLVARDIPFLSEEPLYPVNVMRARAVRQGDVWALRLRETLLPGYEDANQASLCGFLAAVVEVAVETQFTLYTPPQGNYAPGILRVDGQDVQREDGTSKPYDHGYTFRFTLGPGKHLLMWDVSGRYHSWSAAFAVETDPPSEGQWSEVSPFFVTYGPFESTDHPDFQGVWSASSEDDLAPYESYLKQALRVDEHVQMATAHARSLAELPTRPFAALCSSTEDFAQILPQPEGDTEILLDFGRMTVGFWELELDAPEGAILDLVGFESIQDGNLDLTWGLNNALRYTTRAGLQTYHSVIRRGCRYLLVTIRDLKGPLRIRRIRTLLNTYPCVNRGSFQCNDAMLNRIWEMGQWTTRLCSEDTYVDCPTYEQTFWVGDARNEGAVNHYAFGEYALSRRCLILAAQSMERSPLVESQVPSSWEDILPTWSLLWVLACQEYFQITGDREFLELIYPYVQRQNAYCLEQTGKDGLVRLRGWNLLDWAPLDTPSDGACTHTMAWLAMCLQSQADMASVLGRTDEVEGLLQARGRLISAMNERLWNEERQAYIDSIHNDGTPSAAISQQTNTIVVLAGCAPPERDLAIRRLLIEKPEGVVGVGSPFFMFFTFEALARLERFEDILDLTRKWWGFMLDTGATTCWETFPGFEPQGRYTRSHCHAWSAAPTYFQSRYQLGVAPLEDGFGKALIAPEPAGLKWARGTVPTPHGEISVAWEITDSRVTLSAELPPDIAAEIVLPAQTAGLTVTKASGAEDAGQSNGRPRFAAAPGACVCIEAVLSA